MKLLSLKKVSAIAFLVLVFCNSVYSDVPAENKKSLGDPTGASSVCTYSSLCSDGSVYTETERVVEYMNGWTTQRTTVDCAGNVCTGPIDTSYNRIGIGTWGASALPCRATILSDLNGLSMLLESPDVDTGNKSKFPFLPHKPRKFVTDIVNIKIFSRALDLDDAQSVVNNSVIFDTTIEVSGYDLIPLGIEFDEDYYYCISRDIPSYPGELTDRSFEYVGYYVAGALANAGVNDEEIASPVGNSDIRIEFATSQIEVSLVSGGVFDVKIYKMAGNSGHMFYESQEQGEVVLGSSVLLGDGRYVLHVVSGGVTGASRQFIVQAGMIVAETVPSEAVIQE